MITPLFCYESTRNPGIRPLLVTSHDSQKKANPGFFKVFSINPPKEDLLYGNLKSLAKIKTLQKKALDTFGLCVLSVRQVSPTEGTIRHQTL